MEKRKCKQESESEQAFIVSKFGNAGSSYPPRPYCPHILVWSEEMQRTMTQYDAVYKQAFNVFLEIQKLKEEKKRRRASDNWNST